MTESSWVALLVVCAIFLALALDRLIMGPVPAMNGRERVAFIGGVVLVALLLGLSLLIAVDVQVPGLMMVIVFVAVAAFLAWVYVRLFRRGR